MNITEIFTEKELFDLSPKGEMLDTYVNTNIKIVQINEVKSKINKDKPTIEFKFLDESNKIHKITTCANKLVRTFMEILKRYPNFKNEISSIDENTSNVVCGLYGRRVGKSYRNFYLDKPFDQSYEND